MILSSGRFEQRHKTLNYFSVMLSKKVQNKDDEDSKPDSMVRGYFLYVICGKFSGFVCLQIKFQVSAIVIYCIKSFQIQFLKQWY